MDGWLNFRRLLKPERQPAENGNPTPMKPIEKNIVLGQVKCKVATRRLKGNFKSKQTKTEVEP